MKKEKTVIDTAKDTITKISDDFEKNQGKIGEELMNAEIRNREMQKKENTLTECPVCKKGNLAITYSRKNRRHFIACDAYPECKTTYSLPPQGVIKKTDKTCDKCSLPMLMSLRKGKRPWIFCFNPDCESNREWVEKAREKREKFEKMKGEDKEVSKKDI